MSCQSFQLPEAVIIYFAKPCAALEAMACRKVAVEARHMDLERRLSFEALAFAYRPVLVEPKRDLGVEDGGDIVEVYGGASRKSLMPCPHELVFELVRRGFLSALPDYLLVAAEEEREGQKTPLVFRVDRDLEQDSFSITIRATDGSNIGWSAEGKPRWLFVEMKPE